MPSTSLVSSGWTLSSASTRSESVPVCSIVTVPAEEKSIEVNGATGRSWVTTVPDPCVPPPPEEHPAETSASRTTATAANDARTGTPG
ncbi:hypothetical protein [Actinomycetospora succinea]|uniref:hypothetical protein n=1 Tax=Actinomycetospora succinea TaxID=663603 RepID=UPI00105C50A2|nr:hypothetical protein [Actinomycetospora succinea]